MARTIPGSPLVVSDAVYDALVQASGEHRLATLLMDSYVAKEITTPARANYVDVTDDGLLSFFAPRRAAALRGDGYSAHQIMRTQRGRQAASVGKLLRKLIKPEALSEGIRIPYRRDPNTALTLDPIADADVEKLTVAIQARFRPLEFFLVTGEAIRYWYYEKNYTGDERSWLHDSCMRYAQCWNNVRFYAQNPRVCGLLCVLGSDGKLKGRALVWNSADGVFMDRVYASDQVRAAYRRFADQRGWSYRADDTSGRTAANTHAFVALPVQQINPHQKIPYLDTFDIIAVRATGDRAMIRGRDGGRSWGQEDTTEWWLANNATNPICYAALIIKNTAIPWDHPMHRHDVDRHGRDPVAMRDRRVDWLSDFSALPDWPADLIRVEETWTLAPWGSDPEDDAANMAVLPPRRTAALHIERPVPTTSTGTGSLITKGGDAHALRTNIAALEAAFLSVVDHQAALAADDQAPAFGPYPHIQDVDIDI